MSLRGTLRCQQCDALYSSLAGCDCDDTHPRRIQYQAALHHGVLALLAANAIAAASGSRLAGVGFDYAEAEHLVRTRLNRRIL